MGFDPKNIGYLYFCGKGGLGETNLDKITILGTSLKACRRIFRHHRSFKNQQRWLDTGDKAFERLRSILERKAA